MKKYLKNSIILILSTFAFNTGCQSTREPSRFRDMATVSPKLQEWHKSEINAFVQSDSEQMPASGQALFIGSSSIRMWNTLSEDMAPVPTINRGFGGSQTPEVLAVFDQIVVPYAPRIIVYYCGDNDLGTENTDSSAAAMGFIQFARLAHNHWPETEIVYIPIKPSLARWSNWAAMEEANSIVEDYCNAMPHMTYADTVSPTLLEDGTPDPSIFLADGLHMNPKGYAIWTSVLRPIVHNAWEH